MLLYLDLDQEGIGSACLLCISPGGVVGSTLIKGGFKSPAFREFLLTLPTHVTVCLDNASIHHATKSLRSINLPTIQENGSKPWTHTHVPTSL